jgi:hypothetical protein
MRAMLPALIVLLSACRADLGDRLDPFTAGWPDWQRIETGELPEAWRLTEASYAFDAWEAVAIVARLSTTGGVSSLRFENPEGSLDLRMPALPSEGLAPDLREGDTVRVNLVTRLGFEGVAQGLTLRTIDDRLQLLYDDGGYGSAFHTPEERLGLEVERSLRGIGTGSDWEEQEVTFRLEGAAVTLDEGQVARLGRTGLAVKLIVSREWTGELVTDIDLSPLAYLVVRLRD